MTKYIPAILSLFLASAPAIGQGQAKTPEEMLLDGKISAAQAQSEYTFRQGFPTGDTAAAVYANSKLRRAVEAYKTFLPTVTTEAVFQQMTGAGAVLNETGIVMAQGPRQQFAGANSDTPYSFALIDLRKGPMVVEMAANPLLLGLVNDHNMRWVTNLGGIGPDKGKGGKHLLLPPNHEGAVPEGYFVSRAMTWKVLAVVRTVPLDGDVSKAIQAVKDGIKVFPLSAPEAASRWRYIDVTERRLELPLLAWEGRLDYWRQLHGVLQQDVAQAEDRYTMGALEQLSISPGTDFKPDEATAKLLTRAAQIAHAELSIALFANNDPKRIMWKDRRWELLPLATMHLPKGDFGSASAVAREASDQYFFFGWGTSSTIGKQERGGGSVYYSSFKDEAGLYVDGAKTYRLNMPGPLPMKLFWSATVYDAETRCLIETPLMRAAVRSHLDQPVPNSDGSYDITFGPKNPGVPKSNWVQTLPGRGWIVTIRLYGPTEDVFNGNWRLGDLKRAK
jgi:hypothetical protein